MAESNKIKFFLDSGAYSAWSQKTEINIHDYIKFVKEYQHLIDAYANLDVIGSAEGTWENQMIMEKEGLSPIPTYHYGEDIKWLKKYLSLDYDYISLGGMVPISTSDLVPWLDVLFSEYLCDESGMPKVRVHGFGLTSSELIARYPWYSVDSTSWVIVGRMGSIHIPAKRKGKWDYSKAWKVAVSDQNPGKKEAGKHITTLTPTEREIMLEYIHEKGYKLGESTYRHVDQDYELEANERWADNKPKKKDEMRLVETIVEAGVSNKYQLRDEMNIIYFIDLQTSLPEWPWAFDSKEKQPTLEW
jgi:hypothetical protein